MGIEALLQSQVIGLTSALAAKLDLSGGTLTGALSGTSLSLSDGLTLSTDTGITASNWARLSGSNQATRGIAVRNGILSFASNVSLYWSTTLDPTANSNGISLVTNGTSQFWQRSGATAQAYYLSNTYTSDTSFERGKFAWESNVLRIGTEKGSAGGSARALELQTDGTTRLTITATGGVECSGYIDATSIRCDGSTVFDTSGFYLDVGGSGGFNSIRLAANSGGTLKVLLGNTASSTTAPMMKVLQNQTTVMFRVANDSGDCDITAKAATFSGNITLSTVNLVTDATTGTKIATGTTQKLGFWNATPIVQPSAVADATDAASAITQINALLSRLRSAGLIAT